MRLGQCGSGSGDRPPVPPALPAVGTGARCAKVRHLRPRTGPSGLGSDTHGSRLRLMCEGQLPNSPAQRPALV
ncbi:hypothetical protein GTX23_25950 [Streptomyces sp. SID6139]|nr:hypothetical protein [Streptomyces sp. SID6139]